MQQQPTSNHPSPNSDAPLQNSSLVTWIGGKPPSLPPFEQKISSPGQPPVPASPKPPTSPSSGGARRWEIQYGEIKLDQKPLGHGAFGEVFSGQYRKSKVAVKQYDFRGKLPSEQEAMLMQEADVMEGLRSEYLVGFRGICLDPRYCLVMEFCEGGTLRARLDKTKDAITPLEQLRWAMQVSYGVYQLHTVKIVHRDLKGENILLDRQGHAKVADFGLSIVKSNSASHSKSGGRGGAGTIPWMAPELHEDHPNSRETDVYSLGVVLWEIVSRKMPYAGLGVGQMISKTVQGKRDPLPNPCPEVFQLMITACCQMEAKGRPTAEQVGDQFEAALTSVESVPLSVSSLPVKESHELQTQKLKEMEQKLADMQLAHERQLAEEKQKAIVQLQLAQEQQLKAAAEKEQRLAAEKQAEIERIKRQHETELKRAKDLKYETTVQSPKLTPPLPSLSQTIPQTLMAPPKPKASPEQLALQNQLIAACKRGDAKEVTKLFTQGAKPDIANAKGEQPLGAAVWGMCPDVVNTLLKEAKGIAPMTWQECEQHNKKYYNNEVFIVPKFDPQTFREWNTLLQKMDPNPFIRAYHLKKVDDVWHDSDSSSWEKLKSYISNEDLSGKEGFILLKCFSETEIGYVGYRSQIKQGIETAKHLTVEKTF